MSNLNNFLDLLAELNPLHRLDPYRHPLNQHLMNPDTSKPKMEKGDNGKEGTKQATKRIDSTTPQPSVNKATNSTNPETLKIHKPTPTLSPGDAAEWEEVFKPELGSDSGSDEWEMIDELDAKPCVVPAKKLLEKRQKKVESLEKLDLKLGAAEKSTGKGTKDDNKWVKVDDGKGCRKELKGDIKRIGRLLDEVNAENSRS